MNFLLEYTDCDVIPNKPTIKRAGIKFGVLEVCLLFCQKLNILKQKIKQIIRIMLGSFNRHKLNVNLNGNLKTFIIENV